jgi:CheY-like chemotaxis protein
MEKPKPAKLLWNTFSFRHILVIEDSATIIEQITCYLQELNIKTVAHTPGKDALDKVVEMQPDLVLLDLQLPKHSGWQILTQLKADARSINIPVIIISVVDEWPHGLALGAAEHLVKPISRRQLQQVLSRVARQQADIHPAPLPQSETQLQAKQPLILLAEDNEANIQLLTDYLTDEGYRVVTARNGLEAIERATAERPALFLMDIQMPGMDGLEATRRIRADTQLADIPIIALTALAMPGDRERCLAAGANDYLSKPVSLKKLVGTIAAYLEPAKT